MEKINNFTKDNIHDVKKELEKKFKEITELCGVNFKLNSIRYSESTFKVTLDAFLAEKGQSLYEVNWPKHCISYGFSSSELHKEFTTGKGMKYKIVGLNPKARKYPIVCKNLEDGKDYVFTPENVMRYLYSEKY